MVIVSNGHNKFQLAPLASELAKVGLLARFLTGAYPGRAAKFLGIGNLVGGKAFARLLAREEVGIPSEVISSSWLSEIVLQTAQVMSKYQILRRFASKLECLALKLYSLQSGRVILNSNASIYHYRAGYGLGSVAIARRKGMVALCDHSIVNPALVEFMVAEKGRWPKSVENDQISEFWRLILHDIYQADYVIVNSEFVKQSFVRYGFPEAKLFVRYWGVDNAYLAALPERSHNARSRKCRLAFSGDLSKRKGADILAKMLDLHPELDFELHIMASVRPEMESVASALRKDPRVRFHGYVSRSELAQRLVDCDVFLFPTLVEGSARVVFEALAAGCYIITTKNAGSIVADGVHGSIVEPGSADALASALRVALINLTRVREIGDKNAALIRSSYTQEQYGKSVLDVYESLLKKRV